MNTNTIKKLNEQRRNRNRDDRPGFAERGGYIVLFGLLDAAIYAYVLWVWLAG